MKKSYCRYRKGHVPKIMAAVSAVIALLLVLKLHGVNDSCTLLEEEMGKLQEQNQRLQEETAQVQEQNRRMQSEIVKLSTEPKLSPLSVKGVHLYNEQGEPVVLRGISSHGITWYPEYTNYRSLKTLKAYGANVFRVAMYVEQNDGYKEEPELNRKLLYCAVENSLAAGLYTIVDWHVLQDENPNRHIDKAIEVFEEIAMRYQDEPGVIYEICNEPNGDTTYEDIKSYAEQVIPVIRKYAPDAVILVGTPDFCTSLSEAVADPLDYPNVMYTYHYYAGISDCKYAIEEISNGLEQGLPVLISEWGLDGHEIEDHHMEETRDFLDFLHRKQIGWVNWSLSNKDEGYSLIRPDSGRLHGWEEYELTDTGRFVLQYLSKEVNL